MTKFSRLHWSLLNHGIYIGPSGYEVGFISQAHTPEVLAEAAQLFCACLDEVFEP